MTISRVLHSQRSRTSLALFVALLSMLGFGAASASTASASQSAWWHLMYHPRPTALQAGGEGTLTLVATNMGYGKLEAVANPVEIKAELPAGFKATEMTGVAEEHAGAAYGGPVKCEVKSLSCEFVGALVPYGLMEVEIKVKIAAGTPSGENEEFEVSGGNAPGANIKRPVVLGRPAVSGVQSYELNPEEEGGRADTQAGSHPFQYTTSIILNENSEGEPVALAKDLHFKQPAGFFGNPSAFKTCSLGAFTNLYQNAWPVGCPAESAVGVAKVWVHGVFADHSARLAVYTVPVYLLEPSHGEPARFGFTVEGSPVFLDTSVRTGGDYGITVNVLNLTQLIAFSGSIVTIWGVPGDPRHDDTRDYNCLNGLQRGSSYANGPCEPLGQEYPPPFLSMPTSCTGPLQSSVEVDSWKEPSVLTGIGTSEPMAAQDGCNRLPFTPFVEVAPDGQAGSTPTGLTVGIKVPQDVDLASEGLAEATVKNTTVTLPEGVSLAAGGADGLESCAEEQVGLDNDVLPSCPECGEDRDGDDHDAAAAEPAGRRGVPGAAEREPVRVARRAVSRRAGPGLGSADQARGGSRTEPCDRPARLDVQRTPRSCHLKI